MGSDTRQDWVVNRPLRRGTHVLVTGIPGSGKSTLAEALSTGLDLPLLAKDDLRDVLIDSLGITHSDRSARMKVGMAAVRLQYRLMATMPSMVIDCALWTDRSEPELRATGRDFVQVFCSCPFEVARERVRLRERWDSIAAVDEYERFRPLLEPLRLEDPLVTVSTEQPVDIDSVANEVRRLLAMGTRA